MATHTPGPWKAERTGNGHDWEIHRYTPTHDGAFFCRVDSLHHGTKEGRDTAEANARLIAAAPELLELAFRLQQIIKYGETQTGPKGRDFGLAGKVDAAIAKATRAGGQVVSP